MEPGKSIAHWHLPDLPASLEHADLYSIHSLFQVGLADQGRDRTDAQNAAAGWLYRLVRANIRRGRVYEPAGVLASGSADCLGYARVLAALGEWLGLEMGVVEVLIDNMGRYVPHHVSLLTPDDGSLRFLDPWYGSDSIRHQRYGVLADGRPADINASELTSVKKLKGLPERCIEAIVLYIRGNRALEQGETGAAIGLYSQALALYPNNSRAFYNRALAHERRGDNEAARLDYEKAFGDEASIIRVMARIDCLEPLIALDENGISEEKQDIFLRHKGFKTGSPAGAAQIAREYGLPADFVERTIREVESIVPDV